VEQLHGNPAYRFLSAQAQGAVQKWGVKSISLLAIKETPK
jgi:hypothetical protein